MKHPFRNKLLVRRIHSWTSPRRSRGRIPAGRRPARRRGRHRGRRGSGGSVTGGEGASSGLVNCQRCQVVGEKIMYRVAHLVIGKLCWNEIQSSFSFTGLGLGSSNLESTLGWGIWDIDLTDDWPDNWPDWLVRQSIDHSKKSSLETHWWHCTGMG